MTLDQLYYFKKLAELQHFTKAATELYISQPSLSHSIHNLEKELDAPLFKKIGRNIGLTEYGKEFYKIVDEVLAKLDDGVAIFKNSVDRNSIKIDIGTVPIFPGNFITNNIANFMKLYPQTKFNIFTCINNKEVINGIKDGLYDLGFVLK